MKKRLTLRQLRYWVNRASKIALKENPLEVFEPEPGRKPLSFYASKRKAAKLQRTPKWANHKVIAAIFFESDRRSRLTGIRHHVDHILPFQGRTVSGLHVETNLQILTAAENVRKGNRLDC